MEKTSCRNIVYDTQYHQQQQQQMQKPSDLPQHPHPPHPSNSSCSNMSLPMVIDASSWKRGGNKALQQADSQPDLRAQQQQQLHPPPRMGNDRERMKDLMAESFSRNETISILPGFKETRSIAKPCIRLASSSVSSISSGYAEKPPSGPHTVAAWKAHHLNQQQPMKQQEFQHYQQQQQQQQQNQQQYHQQHSRSSSPHHYSKLEQQSPKILESRRSHGGGGDNEAEPWPYSKCQKSQKSIREAQAAYKRDLDKQIEEKNRKQNVPHHQQRPSQSRDPINKPSTGQSGGSPPPPSHAEPRQCNQSVSLEGFRNTGFLPPWFDPLSNNPLCVTKKPEDGSSSTSSSHEEPGIAEEQIMIPPEQMSYPENPQQAGEAAPQNFHHNNNNNNYHHPMQMICNNSNIGMQMAPPFSNNHQQIPEGNFYIVTQEMLEQINHGGVQLQSLPLFSGCAPPQAPQQQQQGSSVQPSYQSGSQTEVNNNNNKFPNSQMSTTNLSSHITPRSQPPPAVHISQIQAYTNNNTNSSSNNEPHQNSQWTPWLNSSTLSVNLRNLPPPPTPPSNSDGAQSTIGPPSPATSTPQMMSESNEQFVPEHFVGARSSPRTGGGESFEAENNNNSLTDSEVGSSVSGQVQGAGDEENSTSLAPHVSQTSNQLPSEETMRNKYKSDLAKQIEEKKKLDQMMARKDEEEEAKLQRKLEHDQQRMLEEYEQEEILRKTRQEEYKKRQELVLKEKERFERIAEQERQRKKEDKRRKSQQLHAASNNSLSEGEEPGTTPKTDPNKSEGPTDLTVCAAFKWPSTTDRALTPLKAETSSSDEELLLPPPPLRDSPRPQTVVISHHRLPNESDTTVHPASEPPPYTTTKFFEDKKLENDVSFLSDMRKALIAERRRVGRQMKKREQRYFVSI